ncbi:MAG TPA: DUF6790 family protein [Ignavibacteriaceae bacterium]|nr:DUF6790 family protein [Ignavibacteriaceae bacterium]
MKANRIYLYSAILLMFILPTISVLIDYRLSRNNPNLFSLIGKWFVFWSVGCRLLIAGLRQTFQPEFTAETIFHFKDKESFVVIRELGFANICAGLTAIISLVIPQWRIVAAFSGGLFLGIAGLNHLIRNPDDPNERIPMISNLLIFLIMAVYLINYIIIGK